MKKILHGTVKKEIKSIIIFINKNEISVMSFETPLLPRWYQQHGYTIVGKNFEKISDGLFHVTGEPLL